VLARTFAVRAALEPRHADAPLCDLTHCQVYPGAPKKRPQLGPPRILVEPAGKPSAVYFHSTCGGQTLSARAVWGERDTPSVVGVRDVDPQGRAWCGKSPHFRWVHDLGEQALSEAVSSVIRRPVHAPSLELSSIDASGARWWVRDREGAVRLSGESLHLGLSRKLGFSKVKSSRFKAERAGDSFRLSGHGLGHRVGLCQYGAIARAKAGQTADQILAAYFPKLDLAEVEE
jgi:stage II sporulation protein D